jgi:membrane-associated phospholipid phosphatase
LIDLAVSAWFHEHTHPVLTQIMLAITNVHGTLGICILATGVGYYLWQTHRIWWLLALLLSVPGGLLLNAALKQIFRRARPYFDDPLLTLATYSFPSGHTAGTTVLYGFVAVLLLSRVHERRWRVAILAGAGAMVALVALSRVYLGLHYLSDVVVAVIVGLLWLALCLVIVRAMWRRSMTGES